MTNGRADDEPCLCGTDFTCLARHSLEEHAYWAGHFQTGLREAEAEIERLRPLAELGDEAFRQNWRKRVQASEAAAVKVLALAYLIDRHTEREAEPVEFRHADTGMWHDVADELRSILQEWG